MYTLSLENILMASSISESLLSRWARREWTLRLSALSGSDNSSVTRERWAMEEEKTSMKPWYLYPNNSNKYLMFKREEMMSHRGVLCLRDCNVSCLSLSGIKVWPVGMVGSGVFLFLSSSSFSHCFFLSSRLCVHVSVRDNRKQHRYWVNVRKCYKVWNRLLYSEIWKDTYYGGTCPLTALGTGLSLRFVSDWERCKTVFPAAWALYRIKFIVWPLTCNCIHNPKDENSQYCTFTFMLFALKHFAHTAHFIVTRFVCVNSYCCCSYF